MSNVTSIADAQSRRLSAREIAERFHEECEAAGFRYRVDGTTVRITESFEPGDAAGFRRLDCDATSLLYTLPSKSPVYGVDGVGGQIALERGHGTVQVPAVRATVARELTRLLDETVIPDGTIGAALRAAMPELYGRRG